MNFMRVTLHDVPEGGSEWGFVNVDSIQMIICKEHYNRIPIPTTLVMVGREIRVTETIVQIVEELKKMREKQ